MEERLFFIGLAMGAYAWVSQRWGKSGGPHNARQSGLWHALFCALAGFSAMLVIAMSMESRSRFVPLGADAGAGGGVYASLAVALVAGVLGFWRAHRAGAAPSGRKRFFAED